MKFTDQRLPILHIFSVMNYKRKSAKSAINWGWISNTDLICRNCRQIICSVGSGHLSAVRKWGGKTSDYAKSGDEMLKCDRPM